jgi:hypothetical protein
MAHHDTYALQSGCQLNDDRLQANLVRFKPESSPRSTEDTDSAINAAIWTHQENASPWTHAQLIGFFHLFVEGAARQFNLTFTLPVIEIENLDVRTVAKYYAGRNGMGLCNQITLNIRHLRSRDSKEQLRALASLTTCLLQADMQDKAPREQSVEGRVDYFSTGLVQKASQLGIRVDRQGHVFGIRPGPFLNFLKGNGIHLDWREEEEIHFQPPTAGTRAGSSARAGLRKWVCNCPVIVRHAGDNLAALCLRCNAGFQKVCH